MNRFFLNENIQLKLNNFFPLSVLPHMVLFSVIERHSLLESNKGRLQRDLPSVRRDGSAMKTTGCSHAGPGFSSRQPYGGKQSSGIPVLILQILVLTPTGPRHPHGTQMYVQGKHSYM